MLAAVLETRNYIVGEANAPSGLYIGTGAADAWRHAGWRNLRCTAIAQTPDALFLGSGNGVLRSRDGGSSWRVTTDWRITEVLDLVASPTDPGDLVAATAYGLVRTRDAGETWVPVPPPGRQPDPTFASAVVLDAEHPSRMLIATAAGLFVSEGDGSGWRAVGPRVEVRALAQSTTDPHRWLAGTAGRGAWLSTDKGETWESIGDASSTLYAVAFDPNDPDCLAVGGYQTGVCLSPDGGSSWRQTQLITMSHPRVGGDPCNGESENQRSMDSRLRGNDGNREGRREPDASVYTLAFDPHQPGRLWIGTMGDGVFTDDGEGWQEAGLPETTVTAFSFA